MADLPVSTPQGTSTDAGLLLGKPPLVTFALFTYKQAEFIDEAVQAALAQTYSPLQILISDDCSPDNTWECIEAAVAGYQGPHQIKLNRNARNMGLIAHINHLVELADGELIIECPGDDVSLPQRTERLVEAYLRHGRSAMSLHSDVICIDMASVEMHRLTPTIVSRQLSTAAVARSGTAIIGAALAWPKAQFERFGPITESGTYEDLVMSYRSMLSGGHIYIPEILVKYRQGSGITSKTLLKQKSHREKLLEKVRVQQVLLAAHRQRLKDNTVGGTAQLARVIRISQVKNWLKLCKYSLLLACTRNPAA